MSSDGNTEYSFTPLPPEPNGRNKSMGAEHDRIPTDLANFRHNVHSYTCWRSFPELTIPGRRRRTDLRKVTIFKE
jgi:hypothetical protein